MEGHVVDRICRIRDAAPGDLPAILAINAEAVPGVGALSPREATFLLESATLLRVAEAGDRTLAYLIGFASETSYDGEELRWFQRRSGSFLYIDQVAVAAEARGRGVASELYADLESTARSRGHAAITLEVNLRPENAVSLRFHACQGFAEVGRLETRDGRLVSLMEKRLAPLPGGTGEDVHREGPRPPG